MKKKSIILLLIISLLLIVLPLVFNPAGEFAGADDQAGDVITEMNEDYEPWFESIWEPPSGEIESLLFCSQAALGAGFIGYFIGKKSNGKRC
ncbi:energy-coupling factor ABC transporter substrate-binding protein [Clostridium botulinum]|nr:energy-coupling factor ABC transporter substrate-binding protein [Clostridium botulinum]NFM04490.1 energy-coupling factor ABC transporter substrate-binding protein [Clostridium botulinum]NFN17921.1 energy-coupling factor ABC transporter substrate-binding protein [Clostridium botulinum]NFN48131.1 energy-coupling factor ABC transporter substrate-binding protein [Clostridium botulinum]